ncbi:pectinesterase precursor [Fusarium oxysporum f. sp. phaseoli]
MARGSLPPPVRRYNLRSHAPRHLKIFNPPLEPCGDFHLFARFPADIRWLVWQQALSHERWIDITLDRFDYTYIPHLWQMLAKPEEYNIVLGHCWRISKLFRTTSESRRAALAFYRVQLPCWYERKDKTRSRGTLYVCPELDTLNLRSLALGAFLVTFGLMILVMNLRGSFRRGCEYTCRSNHTVPIRGDIQGFKRLPYDPRLHDEDLRRVELGVNPRTMFKRWFELLEGLGVQHRHKVIYQFGSSRKRLCRWYWCPSVDSDIHDRDSASEWLQGEHEQLKQDFDGGNKLGGRKVDWDHEIASIFETSPQPVIGFWLFPMESVFTPADLNGIHIHTGSIGPRAVDMSQYMPELCLADIF